MRSQSLYMAIDVFIIIGALFSIVYTFGVVWRVEKKLDISYKLILGAIISFTLSEIFMLLELGHPDIMKLIGLFFRAAFIAFFLLGILEVRKMIRQMDGELPGRLSDDDDTAQ